MAEYPHKVRSDRCDQGHDRYWTYEDGEKGMESHPKGKACQCAPDVKVEARRK